MTSYLSYPNKNIQEKKIDQLNLVFIDHITQDTIFSKYLNNPEYSRFFSDVLWYLNKNFLPFSDGLKTIFLYLISSQSLSHTSSDIIEEALPTYEESQQTLDFLRVKESDFMQLDALKDMEGTHKNDLYSCLVIFIEWIQQYLGISEWIDDLKTQTSSYTQRLLLGNNLNELLSGFDVWCCERMRDWVWFGSELSMFFIDKQVSDLFENNASKNISELLNIIHNLMLWKLDDRVLKNIKPDYIYNLRQLLISHKLSLKDLDYMSMDFPNIFWYVSDDNYQRSEFIMYTVDTLLKDFEVFMSIMEREYRH